MSTKIAVIESRWGTPTNGISKNTTVKPLFDFLSDLHYGNSHAYEYEMVGTVDGFTNALDRLARSRATTIVYLAMHGDRNGLYLHGGERISRTVLKNRLVRASDAAGSNLTGIYFGSCLFGTRALASYLFERGTPLKWIAGYQESVDFVYSSALDLMFFNTYLDVKFYMPSLTIRQRMAEVSRRIKMQMDGLTKTPLENGDPNCGLGFSVYVRRKGQGNSIDDLLRLHD